MLKVYIEEHALEEPQPMEVSPDAPVARLVPALVDELKLPRTDLFGNRLVYFLRHSDDGRVLPDHFSLRAAGIADEDCLSLESYTVDGASVLATPSTQSAGQPPAFYADRTIADESAFDAAGNLPPAELASRLSASPPPRDRRWTRRALLVGGGVALGLAGVGVAYAGLREFAGQPATGVARQMPVHQVPPKAPVQTAPATKIPATSTFVPARANAQFVFTRHQQPVHAVSWSPDGTELVSGGMDQQLLVWNTNGQVQFNKGLKTAIHAVAWSPDARQLAVGAGTQVLLLNAQSGALAANSMNIHTGQVTALAWSAKQPQNLVSGSLDTRAVVWNAQTLRPLTTFRGHTTGILAAGWAADGQTVATSSLGGVTRVWNGARGQEVHGFYVSRNKQGKGVALDALAFQPVGGNLLAIGGEDGILRLWQNGLTCQTMGKGAMQGQCLDPVKHLTLDAQPIHALAWSPDGRFLATGGSDNLLLIWYPAQSQVPLLKIAQKAPVLALSWSPDGKMVAAASGTQVTLWALS